MLTAEPNLTTADCPDHSLQPGNGDPKLSFCPRTSTAALTGNQQHPSLHRPRSLSQQRLPPPLLQEWHWITSSSQPSPFLAAAKVTGVLARTRTRGERGCSGASAGTRSWRSPEGKGHTQGSITRDCSGREGPSFFRKKHNKVALQGRKRRNPSVVEATLSEHSAAPQHLARLSAVLVTAHGQAQLQQSLNRVRTGDTTRNKSVLGSAVPMEGMKNSAWV